MPLRTDRLQELREKQGMSQRALAKLCHFSDNQFHLYESGKREPSLGHLSLIAEKLGVSTDYLLGLSDEPRGLATPTLDLSALELEVVNVLRRDGWPGLLRLMADQMSK